MARYRDTKTCGMDGLVHCIGGMGGGVIPLSNVRLVIQRWACHCLYHYPKLLGYTVA